MGLHRNPTPHSYRHVPNDHDDSEECPPPDPQVESLRRKIRRLSLALGGVSVLLAVFVFLRLIDSLAKHGRGSREEWVVGTTVAREAKLFEDDPLFSGPSNAQNDAAWGSLAVAGDGFVTIPDRDKYGLPPGIDVSNHPGGDVYDVSLFHQLHCLQEIRGYLWTLQFAVEKNTTEHVMATLLAPKVGHVGHCFDYIRQAIMCAGDLTLEWPRMEADGRRFAVDGWGITHQCANWDDISAFMKDNAYTGAERERAARF